MEIHMRTTKRFTPTVLARFLKIGRGTGTFENYILGIGWVAATLPAADVHIYRCGMVGKGNF
jgi:hypothetical protein